MPVNSPCSEYVAAKPKWERARRCYEGSDAVKDAGDKYLPRLESQKKEPAHYDDYKLRALFYNATGRTVDGLSGAIFQKAPTVELPDAIKDDAKDVTLSGVSAEMFGLKTAREVLTTGRYGVLVDMATAESPEQRPYWVGYKAEDIIAWRVARRGGDEILTCVVLCETFKAPDPKDRFAEKCYEQYRVLELSEPDAAGSSIYTQTIYRQNEQTKDWAQWAEAGEDPVITPMRRNKPLDFIPFVFIGPTAVSPEIEKPPLLDLVDVNLSHYRTMADLEHGRHLVALPTRVVIGSMAGNGGTDPVVGGSSVVWFIEKGGDAKMLEFTGQGLTALETADKEKRALMATLGARLLEEQAQSAETATAVGMRHSGEHATLRTIAQAIEQGLTMVLRWHAWWMGIDDSPQDVEAEYELNKDFWSIRATPDEVRALVLAYQAETISFKTLYEGLQRGGWTREGVDSDEEQQEIQRQSVARPATEPGRNPDPNDPMPPGADGAPVATPPPPAPAIAPPGAAA